MGKWVIPLCNTVVLKLNCLTGYYKRFYRILFSLYFFCFTYFVSIGIGQKYKLVCPKVYEINAELSCKKIFSFRHKRNFNPKVIGYIFFNKTACGYVIIAFFIFFVKSQDISKFFSK